MIRFVHKRRRFRFSLTGLLVAVTLAAALAGWTAYQLDWIRQRRDVLRRDGNDVHFFPAVEWYMPEAPWPIRWFGEQGHAILVVHRDPQRAALTGTGPGAAKGAESLLTAGEQRELEQICALFPEASGAARFE